MKVFTVSCLRRGVTSVNAPSTHCSRARPDSVREDCDHSITFCPNYVDYPINLPIFPSVRAMSDENCRYVLKLLKNKTSGQFGV